MQWTFFSDEMPDENEAVLVTFHDTGAEEIGEPFNDPAKTAEWFHTAVGCVHREGFGHAFYVDGNKVSERQHSNILASGRWVYVHDLVDIPSARFINDTAEALVVHGSRRGVKWR